MLASIGMYALGEIDKLTSVTGLGMLMTDNSLRISSFAGILSL